MLGLFDFSVTHRTLTWTTGSLTCVRDHSYAIRIHTRGLGRPTVSTAFLTQEKLTNFSCAPDRVDYYCQHHYYYYYHYY